MTSVFRLLDPAVGPQQDLRPFNEAFRDLPMSKLLNSSYVCMMNTPRFEQ